MSTSNERIRLDAKSTTVLCAVNAEIESGEVRLEVSHTQLRWYSPGSVTWEFEVDARGEYKAAICCSCISAGISWELTDGASVISGGFPITRGYFRESDSPINYERISVDKTFSLTRGITRLSFTVSHGSDPAAVSVSSIEITPVSAMATISEEAVSAMKTRPNTDWFVHAGYGLMFHWTSRSAPKRGPIRTYRDAVEAFGVSDFADMCAETGAGYVMFTANHADPSFPGPIRTWESMYPGWTSNRDLVAEMATALSKRGIRLFLYLNTFAAYIRSGRLRNIDDTTEFRNDVRMRGACRADYLTTSCDLLTEIGNRYGTDLAGYWFDSWYQPFMHFGHFPMEPVYRASKAGNPDRLCTFNWWILPNGTPWQDYWAGEAGGIGAEATERYPDYGPGAGLQRHTLLIMDDPWVHERTDTPIVEPCLKTDELVRFIRANMEVGGIVTVNLGIYQDGGVGDESLDIMRAVRKAVRS